MLRIVPHTVPRVGRSYEHFPDGFELHLLKDGKHLQLPTPDITAQVESVWIGNDYGVKL